MRQREKKVGLNFCERVVQIFIYMLYIRRNEINKRQTSHFNICNCDCFILSQ